MAPSAAALDRKSRACNRRRHPCEQRVQLLLNRDAGGIGSTRMGVARAMLELGIKVREAGEFEARLAALEERSEQKEAQKRAA